MCRLPHGSAFIELSLFAPLLVVVSLLCLNMGMVLWGISRNDQACHDAARAAADGKDPVDAFNRAKAELLGVHADGYWFTPPHLISAKCQYEDFSGTPPADQSPYVTVTTSADVRIPVPILYFGASFNSVSTNTSGQSGVFTATKSYTYPLVKTAPTY